MIVLVTGGRDYKDRAFVFRILDAIHAKRTITLLVEGGASGADTFARQWAQARRISFKTFEAEWDRYGGHAGRVRNCRMLREAKPDMVAAFAGGVGTRHMCSIAREAAVPVLESWKFGGSHGGS